MFGNLFKKKEEDPAVVHFTNAQRYLEDNNLEPAIQEFYKAIELQPNFAEAYRHLGFAFARKGDYTNANNSYSNFIRLNPNDSSGYFIRAKSNCNLKNYRAAIDDFQKAMSLNHNYYMWKIVNPTDLKDFIAPLKNTLTEMNFSMQQIKTFFNNLGIDDIN